MSLSKEHPTGASPDPLRVPKCTRCRHHGTIVPQKGHIRSCPFRACGCWKCCLITERTRVTALQRRMKKAPNDPQNNERQLDVRTVKPAARGSRAAPAPREDAPLPAAFRMQRAAAPQRSRRDSPSRSPPGGERSGGSDSGGQVVPFATREVGPRIDFGEFGQAAALPVLHVPWMLGYRGDYAPPRPNILLNAPWLRPLPAGLCSYGHRGPPMFPLLQPPAPHYPMPPVTWPILFEYQPPREQPTPWQPPPSPASKHTEPDVEVD
ncbi:doublesex- and mab-3-related transcription factor B1-like [Pungitius pungitius]|uniref:doublesex- and mab-3-related transcription factor B1-like n=1 Tax=Pungitius pungitius TaxID=134920 RepID=UPI002E13DE2F